MRLHNQLMRFHKTPLSA